jgi:hypothetical protein
VLTTHRQPFSPFGAPAFQYKPATFAGHPLPEAVNLFSLAIVGLERSFPFHDTGLSTLWLSLNNKNINNRK